MSDEDAPDVVVGDKRKAVEIQRDKLGRATGFKKPRTELVRVEAGHENSDDEEPAATGPGGQLVLAQQQKRTSALSAPTMQLSGHEGAVYTCKFNNAGDILASGSHEKLIFLWNVYGDCENLVVMKGHAGAVLDLCWSRDDDLIFTASADKTGAVYDSITGERIKRLRSHTSFVNSVSSTRRGPLLVATGSDDCQAKIWDLRQRHETHSFTSDYQITGVEFSDDSTQLFTAGIDNVIKCWDVRKGEPVYTLEGHNHTITGLALSPDGSFLLSNSMDKTVRMWDVRPYVSTARQVHVYSGASHDFQQNMLRCSWSPDGQMIAAGSADNFVYIWDVPSQRILYKLPGHRGAVHEVQFHPKEPIIVSCGADKQIFLGEL